MSKKEHGTSHVPVQTNLRWNCDRSTADRICNFNRHYAEHSGYWKSTSFLDEETENGQNGKEINFYDSNTGKLLFTAPRGRSFEAFVKESIAHGWPSFRDDEVSHVKFGTLQVDLKIYSSQHYLYQVNWEYVRVLPDGETVSVDGKS